MKSYQKFQRESGNISWNLALYNFLVPALIFLLAPDKLKGNTSNSATIPVVATVNMDDGDSSNLPDVKNLSYFAPQVPLEADFDDLNFPEPFYLTTFDPQVPAEADFDDTCDVIRKIVTERRSACCMTEVGSNKSCL